jgi:transposase
MNEISANIYNAYKIKYKKSRYIEKYRKMLLPVNDISHVLTTFQAEIESLKHTISFQADEISRINHHSGCKDREILELMKEKNLLEDRLFQYEYPDNCSAYILVSRSEYEDLKKENEELRTIKEKFEKLEQKIALMKGGRDSRTSSTAPSQDIGRSNSCSLRPPSERKSGGQPGHAGHHLEMTDTPDEIIDHNPSVCTCCGTNLEAVPCDDFSRRQVVDIPPVQPFYTEHRSHIKTCPSCGMKNKGVFPDRITAPIQYGPVVEATIAYLSVFQYIPYQRIVYFFKHLLGLSISEGTIDSLLEKFSQKAAPVYEQIRQLILSAPEVGADETGCRVNGKKHWFHVWQSQWLTFIVAFAHRSYEVVEEYFPGGFIHAIFTSDCYASQLKTPAMAHQLCLAHLLRELKNFETSLCDTWSPQMIALLCQAWDLKDSMTPNDYNNLPKQVDDINKRLDELLDVDCSMFHEKEQAFIKRLIKHRNSILTFLYYEKVMPDNNASERSIRNVKVKMKVSGQFRNDKGKGADRYAIIRSVVDTVIKSGHDVYAVLLSISKNQKLTA